MVNDRGQLLLVAAVLIGVTVIGTVVLLNDMQYADAAGSQPQVEELDDAERAEAMAERDLAHLVTEVLDENPSRADADDALRENVSVYSNYSQNMTVTSGATTVNATYNESRSNGDRIKRSTEILHTEGSSSDGLVSSVEYMRRFILTVEAFSAVSGGEVELTATNSSEDWTLTIEDTAAGYEIETSTSYGGTTPHCTVSSLPIRLDLLHGTGDCDIDGIRDTIGTVDSVEQYDATAGAVGSYTVDLVGDTHVDSSDTYDYPAQPAVTYRYRSDGFAYNRTILLEDPEVSG